MMQECLVLVLAYSKPEARVLCPFQDWGRVRYEESVQVFASQETTAKYHDASQTVVCTDSN